jgi:Protein of unknown function (DUF3810)
LSLKESIKNIWSHWHWTMLGLGALLIRVVAIKTPQYVEQFYSRGVFLGVRWLFDWSLSWLPFPLLLIFYGIIVFYVIKFLTAIFSRQNPFRKRLVTGGRQLINGAGFIVFSFLTLWGFNYARPSFASQIGLTVEKPDTLALRQELEIAAQEAVRARTDIENTPLSMEGFPVDFEDKIRADVSNFLEKNNFKAGGRLRGRQISPDGFLFRFGISGIYMPFTGEASIDNAVHPLEKPFTMAHELAHGYGWTEEATANFVAYLSCIHSTDKYTRYSGFISYYRYVASNYKRTHPEAYKIFRAQLPEGFRNDLEAINQSMMRYPMWFSTDKLNDFFLKSQGVTEGVLSYSRIVLLVYSWRKKEQK